MKVTGITGAGLVAGAGIVTGSIAAVDELGGQGGKKAAAAASPSATHSAAATADTLGTPASSRDFGIMFPSLRSQPFAEPSDTIRAALLEVGKQGGIMDAHDDLAAGAKRLLLDATVNGNPTSSNPYGTNPANPTMTQGSTFLGQLIDHDVTFDRTSQLGSPANPLLSPNSRTPALDLDLLFGGGPGNSPDLYVANTDGTVGPKLKIGTGGVYETLPYVAGSDGSYTTLQADPRNNETLMLEGLVLAFMQAYNRVLDELHDIDLTRFPIARDADLSNSNERYLVAQEVVLWHYHWLIVNWHLPQLVGQSLLDDVLKHGNRYYNPPRGDAYMPIEFGAAAYRFGHSQVDPSYRANFSSGTGASTNPNKDPFYGLTFDASIPMPKFNEATTFDRDDMLGGFPARRRYIGWQTYFDFGDGQVMNNKKIDTTISSVLFTLPVPAIAPGAQTSPTSLPQRNLLRQLTWALPPGQAIAKLIGAESLTKADLEAIGTVYAPFATDTPLWYYVLAEAKTVNNGLTLGPVGGRIVTETLLGLVRSDSRSYLNNDPNFTPFLGSDLELGSKLNAAITGSTEYTPAHLLYYAGVVQPGIYR